MGPYKPLLLGWWVYPLLYGKNGSRSTPAPHDLPPRSWPFGRSSGRSRGRPGDWSTTRPLAVKKQAQKRQKKAKRLEEIRLTTLGCPKKTLQIYNLPGLFFHFLKFQGWFSEFPFLMVHIWWCFELIYIEKTLVKIHGTVRLPKFREEQDTGLKPPREERRRHESKNPTSKI